MMEQCYFQPDKEPDLKELKTEILKQRNCGLIRFETKRICNAISQNTLRGIIDRFVSELGYCPLGEKWKETDEQSIRRIITLMLQCDLAYGESIMHTTLAEALAKKIISFFPERSYFFTSAEINATVPAEECNLSSFYSISDSAFDCAVVIVGEQRIGIICAEDED